MGPPVRSPPDAPRLDLKIALALTLGSLLVASALAELYARVPVDGAPWERAAVVHTALAAVVLGVMARAHRLKTEAALRPWWAFAPAGVVLSGAFMLAAATRWLIPATEDLTFAGPPLAWILWVPVVEELVFRAGLMTAFERHASGPWAVWFSAVLFALVHAEPTVARLAQGQVGVPLGPLLLGLLAGSWYLKTRRIVPVMALHAACNATPVLFAAVDGRWLRWLGFLYQ